MNLPDQPENLTLFGYNLNDRLRDPEVFQSRAYDLIHSRFVSQGVKANRWASYIGDIKLLLRPGGWVQMMEYYPIIQSDNGRLTDQAAVRRWWQSYESSMRRMNRDPRIGPRLQQLLVQKGFRDVRVDIERLPIGGWHSGKSFSFAVICHLYSFFFLEFILFNTRSWASLLLRKEMTLTQSVDWRQMTSRKMFMTTRTSIQCAATAWQPDQTVFQIVFDICHVRH
jgi:hypothetical protein